MLTLILFTTTFLYSSKIGKLLGNITEGIKNYLNKPECHL